MRSSRRTSLVLFAGWLTACSAALEPEPEPDELSAQIEPDCSRDGPFILELGEDRDGFAPLLPGEEPMLIHGAQGGTHLILAGRVTTPDPIDRYEIELTAEVGAADCGDPCTDLVTAGQIEKVIEGIARIEIHEDAAELPYLFLVVDGWDPNRLRKITLGVSDACERSAVDTRTFAPSS